MENKSTKWKLLFLAVLFPFFSHAQLCIPCVDTFRIDNNDDITTVTGCIRCITPSVLGPEIDSLGKYILQLKADISGASGFQGVLNAGNGATTVGGTASFSLLNSSTLDNLAVDFQTIEQRNGGNRYFQLYHGQAFFYDFASGNYAKLRANPLTGVYNMAILDEDGTSGLLYHTSKFPTYVGTGTPLVNFTGVNTNFDASYLTGSGTQEIGMFYSGGVPYLFMKDQLSAHNALLLTPPLTGNVVDSLPDESGMLALKKNVININLQKVCNVNDTTTTQIVSKSPTFGYYVSLDGPGQQVIIGDGATNTNIQQSFQNVISNINGVNSYSLDIDGKSLVYGRSNSSSTSNVTQIITFADTTAVSTTIYRDTMPKQSGTFALTNDILTHPAGSSGNIQYNKSGVVGGTSDLNYAGGTFILSSLGIPNMLSDASGITLQSAINISTTTNKAMGQATLSSGTVTINNTLITATSEVIAWYAAGGLSTSGAMSTFYVFTKTPGVSFVLQARNAATALVNNLDNSVVNYIIIN